MEQKITIETLQKRYLQIPADLKNARRWICYTILKDKETGEEKKAPMSPFGGFASSVNPDTWTTFDVACIACEKFQYVGLGFVLGKDEKTGVNFFGIDLDNHADKITGKKLNEDDFFDLTSEFINTLNSYSEYSHSGEGIHIICKGTLPVGARRKASGNVEMYDSGRFFTMTGNVAHSAPVCDRTEEVKPLWEKYLNVQQENNYVNNNFVKIGSFRNESGQVVFGQPVTSTTISFSTGNNLDDEEIIEKIKNSKNGTDFVQLYNGDMSQYGNDHSAADLALCTILAFWCGRDTEQMDRIFRKSALMRPKWDQFRGQYTYGTLTLNRAIKSTCETYTPPREKITITNSKTALNNKEKSPIISSELDYERTIDENGDPVIGNFKKVFKSYPFTDTGNAERFYDYFGHLFRYNSDNKNYMFWNGKTWINDALGYVKKYANALIDVLKSEAIDYSKEIKKAKENGADEREIKNMERVYDEMNKNIVRVSNKAGKEAMISELQVLHNIPVTNSSFDVDPYLLNTESGIVDMRTGELSPFSPSKMLSKNTNVKVSYEEPTTWLKFLHDIFERGNAAETDELINCVQMALGYSFTGMINQQYFFILHGDGSNGKSTFIEAIRQIAGDYGTALNSELLMQNPNSSSQSSEFSIANLVGSRFVSTSETQQGKKLDEVGIKQMTSLEPINAQQKYGKPFSFIPTFTVWMSTNHRPDIRSTDYGIWRRIFLLPFERKFSDNEKDLDMPEKLKKEYPQILGWIIKGNIKLMKQNGRFDKPRCVEMAIADYRSQTDTVGIYLSENCQDFLHYRTSSSVLYQDYKNWAMTNSEPLINHTLFGRELRKKGYQKVKTSTGNYYIGIKLKTDTRGFIFGEEEKVESE